MPALPKKCHLRDPDFDSRPTVPALVTTHEAAPSRPGGDTGRVKDPDDSRLDTVKATLDPARLRDTGDTPDYRFSLANERTFLAWLRTALALTGGGIAVAQFLPELRLSGLRELIAGALLLFGAACAIRAIVHWVACERAMRLRRDLPASRFPSLLAIAVAIGAIGLLVAVAVGVFA